MAGDDGVVDVGVGQPGELGGEGGVALLLSLIKPDVLQDEDIARPGAAAAALAEGPTVSSAVFTEAGR